MKHINCHITIGNKPACTVENDDMHNAITAACEEEALVWMCGFDDNKQAEETAAIARRVMLEQFYDIRTVRVASGKCDAKT